jgi:hypothetical protein
MSCVGSGQPMTLNGNRPEENLVLRFGFGFCLLQEGRGGVL